MNYFILLLLALVTFGSRLYYIKKKKIKFNVKELFVLLFLLYMLLFIKLILLKDCEFTFSLRSMIKQAQWIPSLIFTVGDSQLIQTILITTPFGFFTSSILSNDFNYKRLFKYGFTISMIIEALKLFKLNDIANMNNVLLMTTGFLIGGLIYQILYQLLKSFNKEQCLELLKDDSPKPIKKCWKLVLSLIITYIIGIYTILAYQTYPLSSLDKAKVIRIDDFEISLEEKLSHVKINGYYKTNFNRLKKLFSTKFELNEEPIYGVYILNEPYKPQGDIVYGILVVGWVNQYTTLKINYENTSYIVNLQPGLFTVGYPQTVNQRPILDIYTDTSPNPNLSITFYDESGDVIEIPYYKETLVN